MQKEKGELWGVQRGKEEWYSIPSLVRTSLVRGPFVVRGFERHNFLSHPLKIASKKHHVFALYCIELSSKWFKFVQSTTNCLNLLIKVVDGNYEQKVSFEKLY